MPPANELLPLHETVTAVVVAYDSADVLPACLDALRREGVPPIVVDAPIRAELPRNDQRSLA